MRAQFGFASEAEVLDPIRCAHRVESRLSPAVARKVMEQFRTLASPTPETSETVCRSGTPINADPVNRHALRASRVSEEPLNDKEARILHLLAAGNSKKQIAAAVFLTEGTAKNYVSRIMERLHAGSRIELAMRAVSRRT